MKKIKTLGKICLVFYISFVTFGITTLFVDAGEPTGYIPMAPIPGTMPNARCETLEPSSADFKNNCGTTLPDYLAGLYKTGVAAAGILAVLMIVVGGFDYISTDSISGKEGGKDRIKGAIGGLLLAFGSYVILYTVNPALVTLNLNFGPALRSASLADILTIGEQSQYQLFNQQAIIVNNQIKDARRRADAEDKTAADRMNLPKVLDLKERRQQAEYFISTGQPVPEEFAMTQEESDFLDNAIRESVSGHKKAQNIRDYNGTILDIDRSVNMSLNLPSSDPNSGKYDVYAQSLKQLTQTKIDALGRNNSAENNTVLDENGNPLPIAQAQANLKAKANAAIEQLCDRVPKTRPGPSTGGQGRAPDVRNPDYDACLSNRIN